MVTPRERKVRAVVSLLLVSTNPTALYPYCEPPVAGLGNESSLEVCRTAGMSA